MYNILACIKHVLLMWANRDSTHFKIRRRGSCTPDFLHISSANWDAATVLLSVSHTKPHTHTHTTWLLSANSCLQLFTVRLSDREREREEMQKSYHVPLKRPRSSDSETPVIMRATLDTLQRSVSQHVCVSVCLCGTCGNVYFAFHLDRDQFHLQWRGTTQTHKQ